jgi:membrane protein DedA with SNARE-associated domain
MDTNIVIGWLVLGAFVLSTISFGLGFCAQARINKRRIDELVTVIKRPLTNTQTATITGE